MRDKKSPRTLDEFDSGTKQDKIPTRKKMGNF